MTFAVAAALGGCVYPPDIDGGLINAYRKATADKGPQPRQAPKGVGSLKPAPVRAETKAGADLAAGDSSPAETNLPPVDSRQPVA